jgi:DNA-damage-inducible protein D
MKTITSHQSHQTFEDIKQIDSNGVEFWYARALAKVLEYSDFRNFIKVIDKAKEACVNSGFEVADHIVEVNEMVNIGSGASREMESFALSRYACYLIVQNADPSKRVVANGQTYFALQTRRSELQDDEKFA